MNLSDHIKLHHGSQSEAARYYKVSRQVMAYWLKRGAIVYNGTVYLPVKMKTTDCARQSARSGGG